MKMWPQQAAATVIRWRSVFTETMNHPVNKPRLHRGERGQSLVEFALTLPILLLVLGTIDLGLGFRTFIALNNAAREGVRWVTVYPSDVAGARTRIAAEASRIGLSDISLGGDGYTVTFIPARTRYTAGETVTVQVAHEYELLFGALTGLPTINFTAQATMVVLYDE